MREELPMQNLPQEMSSAELYEPARQSFGILDAEMSPSNVSPLQEPISGLSMNPAPSQPGGAEILQNPWERDAQRFFASPRETSQYERPGADQDQWTKSMLEFQISEEIRKGALVDEYRGRHPELAPYEDYIGVEVENVIEVAAQRRIPLTARQALEAGIERFRAKLHNSLGQARRDEQSQAVRRMALKLDSTGTQTEPRAYTPQDIWNMSKEQFDALDRAVARNFHR